MILPGMREGRAFSRSGIMLSSRYSAQPIPSLITQSEWGGRTQGPFPLFPEQTARATTLGRCHLLPGTCCVSASKLRALLTSFHLIYKRAHKGGYP